MPKGARMKGETKPKAKGSTNAVHYCTPTKENCRCGYYYYNLVCSSSSILRIIASKSLNISRPNAWCLLVGFFFFFCLCEVSKEVKGSKKPLEKKGGSFPVWVLPML